MISKKTRQNKGFTLIELVIVILVLAIMAAIGVSRFISLGTDARKGSVNGMRGAINGAVLLSRAKHKARGGSGTSVSMDGATIDVDSSGVPCAGADGIESALFAKDGFSASTSGTPCSGSATTSFEPVEGGSSTCKVEYSEADGSASVTVTGC